MIEDKKDTDSLSASLTEKYSISGFKEVEGRELQVAIGDIKVKNNEVFIETLAGCSLSALIDTMHRIVEETGKPTIATHGRHKFRVELNKRDE